MVKTTEERLEEFTHYGWMCSEENLNTLPNTAPQAAKDLAQWLTLEGRRSSLAEWLKVVDRKDSRIHGKFWHIGSWTGRMSHTNPNQANIPSPFHGDPTTAVEEIKARYDAHMRALWTVEDGSYLVGTDADGIQLRILAHYMESDDYVEAIVNGDKKFDTDIHNLNRKALGSICKDRDDAKTFIYAWLLGASVTKVAEILGCSVAQASNAVDNFLASLPELNKVKKLLVPRDARKGYFTGLDGRKVKCDSEHLMLAGYLQSGESIIMKRANILWRREVDKLGIEYSQSDFVHDEWQTEVKTYDESIKVGEVQRWSIEQVGKDLGMYCPLAGSTDIGTDWMETH